MQKFMKNIQKGVPGFQYLKNTKRCPRFSIFLNIIFTARYLLYRKKFQQYFQLHFKIEIRELRMCFAKLLFISRMCESENFFIS